MTKSFQQDSDLREKTQMLLQALIKFSLTVFFKIFFKLEVVGAEKAVEEVREARKNHKGIIFAANHTNELDGPVIRTFLPFKIFTYPMYYVAMTREHYHRGLLDWRTYLYGGWLFKLLGAFPAYKGMRDYQASLINHIDLLEQGKVVCIFPEGKISVDTARPSEARGGVAFLAEHTQTNIIPVKIDGLRRIPWHKVFMFKRPSVRIEYKTLLQTHVLVQNARDKHIPSGVETYKDVAEQIMNTIRS